MSIAAKCVRTQLFLLSPNLTDQSSCRILTTHAKTRPILHYDWSIRLGENRLGRVFKHLMAMLDLCRLTQVFESFKFDDFMSCRGLREIDSIDVPLGREVSTIFYLFDNRGMKK